MNNLNPKSSNKYDNINSNFNQLEFAENKSLNKYIELNNDYYTIDKNNILKSDNSKNNFFNGNQFLKPFINNNLEKDNTFSNNFKLNSNKSNIKEDINSWNILQPSILKEIKIKEDFESDSENLNYKNIKKYNFDKEKFAIFKNYKEKNYNTLDFNDFFDINKTNNKKFKCKHCSKEFDKPSSLGGHTSKKHKNKSEEYNNKLKIKKLRTVERHRKEYL